MKTLSNNQQIKTTMDKYRPVIIIGTAEGFHCKNETPAESYNRVIQNMKDYPHAGHCPVWANKLGVCLTSNYLGKEEASQKAENDYNNAVLIKDGEHIMAEGREYKVKYIGPNYSDPIHFIDV